MNRARTAGEALLDEFVAIHGEGAAPAVPPRVRQAEVDREQSRLDAYRQAVHRMEGDGQTALCLSGGGIRSAAFSLGVLQGLAQAGLLTRFHYLSTVSGGGYIGGWLTAWAGREAECAAGLGAIAEVEAALAGKTAPEPLRELRQRQAFLTPKTGLGSADTWAALAHIGRNLALNWVVFLPLLAAVLLLPRITEAVLLAVTAGAPRETGSSLNAMLNAALALFGQPSAEFKLEPHFWLDSAAFLLVLAGLGFSMVNRSTPGKDGIDDAGFVKFVLTPVVLGSFMLVLAACCWMRPTWTVTRSMMWQWPVLCGLAFPLIRVAATVWLLLFRGGAADQHRHPGRVVAWELVCQGFAGAVVGLVAVAGLALREARNEQGTTGLRDVVVFGLPWALLAFLAGQTALSGLTSRLFRESGDRNREWLARASGYYGAVMVGWLAFTGIVLYSPRITAWSGTLLSATLVSGVVALLGGASPWSAAVVAAGRGMAKRIRFTTLVAALSVVFVACASVWLAHGTALLLGVVSGLSGKPVALEAAEPSPGLDLAAMLLRLAWVGGAAALLGLFALAASYFVNVNYFSLNALYRNRLVRSFLGASNIPGVTGHEAARNAFDGLAEGDTPDNPPLAQTWAPGRGQPFPVLNMALNLTATKNTAWQERKAASFTATPLHTGAPLVGYRPTAGYARGLTLGTAMAISGAAFSPNWGYHSSPLTSFLMSIFNLRLGCWLGNPRFSNWKSDGPRFGLSLLWREAMGRTSEDTRFVYLSDGGHFENLGIYEMVRRRCRVIVAIDAGADPKCELRDLGNALRKIGVDLDVTVEFGPIDMGGRGPDPANPGVYCALGDICYPEGGKGRIVYVKSGLYGALPAEVRAHAAANARFPHDSTLNQWFTESQFESYRALGRHAVATIARQAATPAHGGGAPRGSLGWFVNCAETYVTGYGAQARPPARVRIVS